MPANLCQIQIFRLPGKEMHLMATIRKLLRHLIDRPGAPVPAITVDH